MLPKTRGRMRIEPQTYAVFLHQGHVSAMPHTWQQALDWLAQSAYESVRAEVGDTCPLCQQHWPHQHEEIA